MNYFRGKSAAEIFKSVAKTVCVFLAVFTMTAFSGCDLLFPSNETEDKVTISQPSATVAVGESVMLTASSSEGRAIRWTSSDEEIAEVDGGEVKGVSAGTATITASDGKKMAACEVEVVPAEDTPPDGGGEENTPPGGGNEEEKPPVDESGRKLVWSDEFNGSTLDMTKWEYQTGVQDNYYGNTGPIYWGNEELQYYTDGANVKVSDGQLQITAKRENMPSGRTFSSARISTRDKFTTTYGYIEARIKSPAIEGMWPAFWMIPQPTDHSSTNNVYGGWPANGELDIMEAKGRLLNKVDCTLHYGGPDWNNVHAMIGKGDVELSSNIDEWHTYAVDWREDYIAWIVDGEEIYRVKSLTWWTSASDSKSAPFDQPFYILLNLAVGGMYDSYHTPPANFKQASMCVDYVRVYE